jgi:hypothetical protein
MILELSLYNASKAWTDSTIPQYVPSKDGRIKFASKVQMYVMEHYHEGDEHVKILTQGSVYGNISLRLFSTCITFWKYMYHHTIT